MYALNVILNPRTCTLNFLNMLLIVATTFYPYILYRQDYELHGLMIKEGLIYKKELQHHANKLITDLQVIPESIRGLYFLNKPMYHFTK